jgi:hypothetical protein
MICGNRIPTRSVGARYWAAVFLPTSHSWALEGAFEKGTSIWIFSSTQRLEEDLSFDRLGEGSPVKAVRKFLTPLANAEAASMRPPRPFSGWAAISMKRLSFVSVTPAPTEDPFNPFHAELSRALYREKSQAETLAFRLAVEAGTDLVPPVG